MIKLLLENSNRLNAFFNEYRKRQAIFYYENPDIKNYHEFVYGAPNQRSYLYDYFEGVDNIEYFTIMSEMQAFTNELSFMDLLEYNRLFGEYANNGLCFGQNYDYKLKSNLFNILNLIDIILKKDQK